MSRIVIVNGDDDDLGVTTEMIELTPDDDTAWVAPDVVDDAQADDLVEAEEDGCITSNSKSNSCSWWWWLVLVEWG